MVCKPSKCNKVVGQGDGDFRLRVRVFIEMGLFFVELMCHLSIGVKLNREGFAN